MGHDSTGFQKPIYVLRSSARVRAAAKAAGAVGAVRNIVIISFFLPVMLGSGHVSAGHSSLSTAGIGKRYLRINDYLFNGLEAATAIV